ncbi:MAG: hypothetical protein IPM46_10105 [Flavobacteriales bacterium]|nr:hypothetical protein [Flavobacteriales bacterium]
MVHPFLRLLYASALVAVVTTTAAQSPEAQLASLDSLFGGTVRFKFDKRHQLLIDYYDASGRFRQDIVPLEQMDADLVSFSLEEDAVIIRCKAEHGLARARSSSNSTPFAAQAAATSLGRFMTRQARPRSPPCRNCCTARRGCSPKPIPHRSV